MIRSVAGFVGLAALGAILSGCSERGISVKGTVKLGGAPLPTGIVALEPEPGSGTTGAGAVVRVKDGRFEVSAAKKIIPGKYIVRVSPMPRNAGVEAVAELPQFPSWQTKTEIGRDNSPLDLDVPKR